MSIQTRSPHQTERDTHQDNAVGIRAVYEALKEKLLLQRQTASRENALSNHK